MRREALADFSLGCKAQVTKKRRDSAVSAKENAIWEVAPNKTILSRLDTRRACIE
jgi:hypothetical protein